MLAVSINKLTSESESLQQRLLGDFTQNIPATTTAVGLALAAFFLIPLGEAFEAQFLLGLSVMNLVHVYDEYWPVTYSIGYEVLWTITGGIVTMGIFIGVYELSLFIVESGVAVGSAFLVTVGLQYGSAIMYSPAQ